jgi:glycosyltransferase involved in cell wall biosynthesis
MEATEKILFISHDAGRTGAPIVLLHFLRWLKKNTALSFEILLKQGGPLERDFCNLAPTYRLNGWHPPLSLKGMVRRIIPKERGGAPRADLGRLSARRDWGLIYSNTITNGAILAGLNGCACPVISHVHELEYWIERSGPENLAQTKQHTTHYVAVANAVKENLTRNHGIDEEKVSVTSEFIPADDQSAAKTPAAVIRAQLGIPAGAFVIGGSGAEFWRKGHDLVAPLLLALKRKAAGREIHFVWVGKEGDEQQKYEMWHDLKQAGVAAKYHGSGEVSNPLDYFAAMDAFTLLSREDPFPLVCLEAALLGKTVLCFAGAGGIPDLVGEDAGFVVPYLDVETMAEKIRLLVESPELGARLGSAAAEKVRTRHTLDVTAPKLLKTINQFMRAKNV